MFIPISFLPFRWALILRRSNKCRKLIAYPEPAQRLGSCCSFRVYCINIAVGERENR